MRVSEQEGEGSEGNNKNDATQTHDGLSKAKQSA